MSEGKKKRKWTLKFRALKIVFSKSTHIYSLEANVNYLWLSWPRNKNLEVLFLAISTYKESMYWFENTTYLYLISKKISWKIFTARPLKVNISYTLIYSWRAIFYNTVHIKNALTGIQRTLISVPIHLIVTWFQSNHLIALGLIFLTVNSCKTLEEHLSKAVLWFYKIKY